jgi:glycosyltransferase involved in cell wall biosynthesis
MKIAIITSRYPSTNNHYAHTFVHRRSVYFEKEGHDIVVFVPSKKSLKYNYENISVQCEHVKYIVRQLKNFDIVYFHLLNIYPQPAINGMSIYREVIRNNINAAFYMHGSEVQSMSSRNFDFKFNLREFARIVYKDLFFMPQMRWVVKKLINNNCLFITPSNWMKREAEEQLNISKINTHIIPNGIDTELFSPGLQVDDNCRMLCIRPLNSNKYAVDEAIKILSYLPETFTLDIYGQGNKKLKYEKLILDLNLSARVHIISEFIPNKQMPLLMQKYSYYLSPTRMDAQGVSMCEAMSCARVVISSNNTAIPEFISDGHNGIIDNSIKVLAKKIIDVENDKTKKKLMAKNARESMLLIKLDVVLHKEMLLLEAQTGESQA